MRRLPGWWLVPSFALAAACGKAADKPAASAPAAAAPAAAGRAHGDRDRHLQHAEGYGGIREVLPRHPPAAGVGQSERDRLREGGPHQFTANLDGSKPKYYRQAELYFPSLDAAKKGMATPGFKKVADDLANFASGGLTGLLAVETNEPGDATTDEPAAIVTVIYNTPKDTAAFERYYAETHVPLVGANQAEIGFKKAELTRFASNLDGSAAGVLSPGRAVLRVDGCAQEGHRDAGFKKVADDLANFASGGLTGMTAVETK